MTVTKRPNKFSKFASLLALFVCAATLCFPDSVMAQDKAEADQVWYGELDVSVAVLRLEFHVSKDESGKYSGKMVSLDQGNVAVGLDRFEVDGDAVELAIKRARLEFKGKLNDAKDKIKGTFTQMGRDYPMELSLKKSEKDLTHIMTWTGKMKAGKQKFDFQFRVYEGEDEASPIVKLDSFTENDFNRPATIEHGEDGNVTIKIPTTKAKIEGKLNEAKDHLVGKWIQRGGKFDIELRKVLLEQTRDPKAKRPQTPKPPFDYDSVDVIVENKADKLTLQGTLTTPKGDGPFSAVILISGSGPQDRDETIYDHKPFFVIADHLAKNGIATLRYDERGVGESTGSYNGATTDDFADDVEVFFDYLKTNKKIDASKIALVGHSEGGIVAPMVAARRSDVAAIVMLAGPGVPGRQIILNQTRLIAKAAGAGEDELSAQEKIITNVLENIDVEKNAYGIIGTIKDALKDQLSEEDLEQLPVAVEQMKEQFGSPWFKYFLVHDPRGDLKKVKCPVLALNGELDLQVDPDLNFPAIEKALKEGGNKDFETVLLPKLNHLFQECETGAPSEYTNIEQTFAPAALDAMTSWLSKRLK